MNYDSQCPIWSTPAKQIPVSGRIDAISIISPRVGGLYIVDNNAKEEFSELSDHDKVKLTAWLVSNEHL